MSGKINCFVVYSFASLVVLLAIVSCRKPALHKETRLLMGTLVSVEMAADAPRAADGVMMKVWAEAERLEGVFSRYLPESEISRINREAGRGPISN